MVSILETAILAMDTYNRLGAGLNLGTQPIGTFSLGIGEEVGAFAAQSYTRGSEVVISYRGTDGNYIGDVVTGWGQSTGFLTPQAEAAAAFYQQVNGGSIAPNLHITLTGHSLGGGLAGFIGAIYGTHAVTYDQMPYQYSVDPAAMRPLP